MKLFLVIDHRSRLLGGDFGLFTDVSAPRAMMSSSCKSFWVVFDDLANGQVICSSFQLTRTEARLPLSWAQLDGGMAPLKEGINLQMNPGTQMSNLIEIATVEFWIGQ